MRPSTALPTQRESRNQMSQLKLGKTQAPAMADIKTPNIPILIAFSPLSDSHAFRN